MGTRFDANNGHVGLDFVLSGTYVSLVCDAGDLADWHEFSPTVALPYGKEAMIVPESGYGVESPMASGILGLWHLDGISGTTVETAPFTIRDASTHQLHATAIDGDASMTFVPGVLAEAINFSGNDRVDVGSQTILDDLSAMTIVAWIKPSTLSSAIVAAKSEDLLPSNGWFFLVSDYLQFYVRFSGGPLVADSQPVMQAAAWQHIAVSYDGSPSASGVLFVHNGQEVPRLGGDLLSGARVSDANNNLLFGWDAALSAPLQGSLDEILIFDRALNLDEIRQIYLRGAAKIRFQVRVCQEPTCTGQDFVGPDGTVATYFSEENNKTGVAQTYLLGMPAARYFQWQAVFSATTATDEPTIYSAAAKWK